MPRTVIGVNDPKAIRRYSTGLAVDVAKKSYFHKKFLGKGETAQTPIQMKHELESDAGDKISYDLVMQLSGAPIEGDDELEGNEQDLKFYTDEVKIDQMRTGVNTGGRMTRKRTIHDLRKVARDRQSDWWARMFDEILFMYLSGARGINPGFIFPTSYTGFAGNAITAPDDEHLMFGGQATSKGTLTADDKMALKLIDRVKTKAVTMGGDSTHMPCLEPCKIDGEDHFIHVMHPWQEYDLRTGTETGSWLDIQKAAATAEGRKSPLFKGSLGMHNNVILHSHRNAIQFSDHGVGANVKAARGLFLGRQAAVVAFGSPGNGMRFDWHEETDDRGNQVVIDTHSILGVKKTSYDLKEGNATVKRDFGVIATDTAAAEPQA